MTGWRTPAGPRRRFCEGALSCATAQLPKRRPDSPCAFSKRLPLLQRELAAAIFQLGGGDNAGCGHPHRMEFSVKLRLPEVQEFVQHRKARCEIVFLPQESLQ